MTAMAVGVAVFALVNLVLISKLLAVLEERPVWEVVQESSKLSLLIFLGNSAVGLIAVVLWLREEVLPNVLPKVARLFGSEEAHLLFVHGDGRPFGAIHGPDGFRFGPGGLARAAGRPPGRPGPAPGRDRARHPAPARGTGRRRHAAGAPGPPAALPADLRAGRHPGQRHPGRPDQGGEVDP
jgi:hypothetical protein